VRGGAAAAVAGLAGLAGSAESLEQRIASASSVRPPQRGLAATAAPSVNPVLVRGALKALAQQSETVWSRDVIAIADFGLPSSAPRFHLVDLLGGTVTSLRVTHGKGSDPEHSGMLQSFSNAEGSLATSEGAYLTGPTYTGVHGLSRRLIGLEGTNDHAKARAIVIHAAWYAEPEVLAQQGKLGRSDGCFAFSAADEALVLAKLGQGRLIYAGRA
jgi:hypothetical protein